MKIIISLFAGLLFFILTPNILLRLPKNGSKYTVAGVHAVVFALAIYLLHLFLESSIHSVNLKEGLDVYYKTSDCLDGDEDQDGSHMREKDENGADTGRCITRPTRPTPATPSTTPSSGKD